MLGIFTFNTKTMKRILLTLIVALIGSVAVMAQSVGSTDSVAAVLAGDTAQAVVSDAVYSSVTEVPNPRAYDANAYVCNPNGILSPAEVMQINDICEKIDSLTDVELCVVALNSIGDQSPFEFALDLFNEWGVGKKEKNTGVMLFLTLASGEGRHVRFVTGDGIEGLLPDGLCTQYIDDFMLPAFIDGGESYFAMLLEGVKAVGRCLTTTDAMAELLLDQKLPEPNGEPWSDLEWLPLLFGGGYLGNFYRKYKKCKKCGKRASKIMRTETLKSPTRTSSGQKRRYWKCEKCGAEHTDVVTIPRLPDPSSSSSSSGGWSSGGSSYSSGGGSFGGGHSSGGGGGRSF